MNIKSAVENGAYRVWYINDVQNWVAAYELKIDGDEPTDYERKLAKQSLLNIIQRHENALQERPVG